MLLNDWLIWYLGGLNVTIDSGLLKMDWSLPADDCHDYNTGTWLKITDTHDNSLLINQFIAEDCLIRNDSSVGVNVYTNPSRSSNSSTDATVEDKNKCHQIITHNDLEECKVYSVEVIPEYDSFRGQIQSADVIVPPKVFYTF